MSERGRDKRYVLKGEYPEKITRDYQLLTVIGGSSSALAWPAPGSALSSTGVGGGAGKSSGVEGLAVLLDCKYWLSLVHPMVARMATTVKNTLRISEMTSCPVLPPTQE